MSVRREAIEALEFDLAKYPPGQDGSVTNRRLVIRKALQAAHDAGWHEGHQDGLWDAWAEQYAAIERAPDVH